MESAFGVDHGEISKKYDFMNAERNSNKANAAVGGAAGAAIGAAMEGAPGAVGGALGGAAGGAVSGPLRRKLGMGDKKKYYKKSKKD